MRRLALAAVSTVVCGFTFLDDVARKVEKGNQHFDKSEFEAALEAYREAQINRPDAPELHFNVGDALYKQGSVEEAAAAFQKAIESGDSGLGGKAYYNLGNSFYRQQTFDQAIGAYEKALELDPEDLESKVNLEMALEKLQEQQQQQSKSDDQNKDENQDQQNKQDQDQQDEQNKQDQDQQDQEKNEQQSQQQPGELSPEEAKRLLDALKDRESESQKRRRLRLQGKRYRGNPW